MSHLLRDLRYAARALLRTPLFTLGIVLTLALGIGVNAAMFGVVDTLFFKPPAGVQDAGRVVRVYVRRSQGSMGVRTGGVGMYPAFVDLRDAGVFARTAGVTSLGLTMGHGAEAEQVKGAAVSHDYFPLLGVGAARGRLFGAADDRPEADKIAVLSYGFWQRRFQGDSAVMGRSLQFGRSFYTVVGIAARDFGGIDLEPVDVWLPIEAAAADVTSKEALTSRNWYWMSVIARLKPAMRPEDAAAQATLVYRRGTTVEAGGVRNSRSNDSTAQVILGPIEAARGPSMSDDARVSAWIGFVAAVVLLIACANVANLLLARGVSRRREMAVRAGLGAGRAGLLRLLISESVVLAGAGGAAAVLLAMWVGSVARGYLIPNLPKDAPVVDARLLAFTAASVLVAALLSGLVPAVQSSRTDLAEALKSGGHGSTARGGRTRAVLLVAQVALTLVLLVGAGLFVRSLRNVQGLDLGFDADRVLEAKASFGGVSGSSVGIARQISAVGGSNTPVSERNAAYLRMLERVERLPVVASAAASMGTPFSSSFSFGLRAEGRDSIPGSSGGGPYLNAVTPHYFATMGTRIVRGRTFGDGDVKGGAKVTIVTATMARLLWPGQEPLGKCLFINDGPCIQVVGVAADPKHGSVTDSTTLQYFVPLAQMDDANITALMVRARGQASDAAEAVRREMLSDPSVYSASVRSLADQIAPQLHAWKLGAMAFTAFGAVALLIAAMGIFAVISYSVSQRTNEIGIRMALGARSHEVARMVVGQGLRTAAIGVVLGGAGAFALGRAIRSLLYGVLPTDPFVFASVATVLMAVAALAAYLPARRAARTDPMIALRSE
ncbi:MAG: ABC transporter permease [Gemmatimonadales bacterium]